MRKPLVAGNWKMHGSRAENADLVRQLLDLVNPESVAEVRAVARELYSQLNGQMFRTEHGSVRLQLCVGGLLIDRHALGNGLLAGHTNGQPRNLTCRQAISTWPLLGCVLDSNVRAKHWATAERGSFLVTVFADPRAQDVDALVCDPADRRIEHKGPEPYAVVEFDADQPVLLTTGTAVPNGATYLVAIDGAEVTPAERMAEAGYATAVVGKWGAFETVMTASGQFLGVPALTEQMRTELIPQELTRRAFEIAESGPP